MKIELDFTNKADVAAIIESADAANDGVQHWIYRTLLGATSTNDEERFKIRNEIRETDPRCLELVS